MVSRANLSGRRSGGGILGKVQRGPQNPAQDPSRGGIRPGRGGITDRATTQPVEGPGTGPLANMQKNVAMRDRQTMTGKKPTRPRSTLYDVGGGQFEPGENQFGPAGLAPGGRVSTTEQLATRGRPGEPGERGPRGGPRGPSTPPPEPFTSPVPSTIARREPSEPVEAPPTTVGEWFARKKQKAGYKAARDAYTPPSSGLMAGVAESLGSAYVNPYDAAEHARGGFAKPAQILDRA